MKYNWRVRSSGFSPFHSILGFEKKERERRRWRIKASSNECLAKQKLGHHYFNIALSCCCFFSLHDFQNEMNCRLSFFPYQQVYNFDYHYFFSFFVGGVNLYFFFSSHSTKLLNIFNTKNHVEYSVKMNK